LSKKGAVSKLNGGGGIFSFFRNLDFIGGLFVESAPLNNSKILFKICTLI
jgi:hypothetical protein